MIKQYFQYMLSAYEGETLEIRKKARLLLIFNTLTIPLVLFSIIVLEIIIRHNTAFIFLESGLIMVLVLTLVLLKKKKFMIASNSMLVLFIVTFCIFGGFGGRQDFDTTVNRIGLYLVPDLLYVSLIGTRTYQTILAAALAIAALVLYAVFAPFLLPGYAYNANDVSQILTAVILIAAGGLMAYLILKNNGEIISLAEAESQVNRDKNERIGRAVTTSREGMSVGEKLSEFASRTLELVTAVNKNFEKIRKETELLSGVIRSSQDSNAAMLESSKRVKTILGEQNAAVNETSSSVEEITRSMNHISASATSRKETIDRLVQTSRESQKEMDQAVSSIREITRSADDMLHITKVIQDVASQTNVLAMNAAIEASHAGSAGKGFAIVAQEIRKLSVETDRNSKLITASLKKNVVDIGKASAINVRAGEYFQKLSAEVAEVKTAMEEIITGLQEISKGTGSILEAVTEILKMSGDVGSSMNEVDARITDSNGNIQNVAKFASDLKSKVEAMAKSYEDIVHITRLIEQTGKENTQNIEGLEKEISSIMQ